METAIDRADEKSRINYFTRRICCSEEGLPMPFGIDRLGILVSRYHGCKNEKWDQACIYDGGENHIACGRPRRTCFGRASEMIDRIYGMKNCHARLSSVSIAISQALDYTHWHSNNPSFSPLCSLDTNHTYQHANSSHKRKNPKK